MTNPKTLLLAALTFTSSLTLPRDALAESAAGKPTWKIEGPEAMYLWHDEAGWHVRAVAGADQHTFRGTIRGTGLRGLTVTRPALDLKVQLTAESVRFEFDVFKGTVDGLDFQAGPGCVTVQFKIDGRVQPDKVRLGAKGDAAKLFPMDACP